jgi:hypothetical protein
MVCHPMSETQQTRCSAMTLATSCALLAATIAPTAILIAGLRNRGFSADSLATAAIAAGVCWTAAALALIAAFFGNRWESPVQGVLVGMLFRMGLPLAAVLGLPTLDERLAASGIVGTILGVYLVALAVETLLALRMVPSQVRTAKTA